VLLVYRRPTCGLERFLQLVSNCGEFTHCEMFCPDLHMNGLLGCTFTNFSFRGMSQTRDCMRSYTAKTTRHWYAVQELNLASKEFELFEEWNKSQVSNHCAYNYTDLPLQLLPRKLSNSFIRDLDIDQSLTPCKLYCAQAVILALRHALPEKHPVCVALSGINTRLSTPCCIAGSLQTVLGRPVAMK
jgi:hypothetical protein